MSALPLFPWPMQILLGLIACGVVAHTVLAIVVLIQLRKRDKDGR